MRHKSATNPSLNCETIPCVVQNLLNLASRGQLCEAVDALPYLSKGCVLLNYKTITSLLRRITDEKSLKAGKLVHLHLKLTRSKHPDTFLAYYLIEMYAKCGDHSRARGGLGMAKAARKMFDKMPERDFVMIMAYVQSERLDEAVRCYLELRRSDCGYNEYSFAGVLTVCVKLKALWLLKQLHCQVFVLGFLTNVVLSSSVMDAYAKCGEMGDGRWEKVVR
ncbi:hypothetical protein SASPL_125690 [Salvia splendens]|uniref:Pentatricopeptide repeat-containing protein n=1 Tax=Salvia splendens TaxID=180675 RepID=A0A8X8ZQZ2_SALSN|nr:hypothetical protein SASPL_125690 [Salvia splendens]